MAGGEEQEIPETGGVYTFGRSRFADNQPSHFFIRNDPVVDIACGDEHTALVCQNGRVFVFGSNEHGQLGLGHTRPVTKPSCLKQLKPLVSRLVACGKGHTLVATSCGRVFTFGANSDGQLGLGDTAERHEPTEIAFKCESGIKALAAGCLHSALLTESGEAYAWGCNNDGQCGQTSPDPILAPTRILFDSPIASISCGYYHTAFTSNDGVYTMGEADSGKLGVVVEQAAQTSPLRVPVAAKFISVACGGSHTLALTDTGEVHVFGSNFSGQLGMGSAPVITSPVHLKFEKPITDIACGESHSAFLTEDGEVYTCGDTRHGKLCIDATSSTNLSTPTLLQQLLHLQVSRVSCGGCHTMLLARLRPPQDTDVVCSSRASLPPLKVRRPSMQSPSHSLTVEEGGGEGMAIEPTPEMTKEQEDGDSKSNTESSINVEEDEDEVVNSVQEIAIFDESPTYFKPTEKVAEAKKVSIEEPTPRSRLQRLISALRRDKTAPMKVDKKDQAVVREVNAVGDQNTSKACIIL